MNVTKLIATISFFVLTLNLSFAKNISSKNFNESTYFLGDIKKSLLTESEHLLISGNCWVLMKGQNVSNTDYGTLIRKQNNNLSMTVLIPDHTNVFERDTGSGVGNIQEQDWKGYSMWNTVQRGNNYNHNHVYMGKSTTEFIGNVFVGYWDAPVAAMGMMWDNSEIRPRNLGVNHFIKVNNTCSI